MSVTWFMIKSVLATFVIISILQLKVGKDNKTLEMHFTGWMKGLSASKRIQNIAEGGQMLTSDIIKEFTTEDGSRVLITKPNLQRQLAKEKDRLGQAILKDDTSVMRFLQGLKLEMRDLSHEAQEKLKSDLREEVLASVRKKEESLGLETKASDNENNFKKSN